MLAAFLRAEYGAVVTSIEVVVGSPDRSLHLIEWAQEESNL
ncbi:MAG: hypothetical protein ACYDAY_06900 [Candidatus Dormibacteria bacterium]